MYWLALLLQSFDCVCVSFSSSVFIVAIGAFAPSASAGLYASRGEMSRIFFHFLSRGAFGAPGYGYGAFQARAVAPCGRVNPRVPSAPRVMDTAPSRRSVVAQAEGER